MGFERVDLPHGFSLEVPSHWKVVTREFLDATKEKYEELDKNPKKLSVLFMVAERDSEGNTLASIRISFRPKSIIKKQFMLAVAPQSVFDYEAESYMAGAAEANRQMGFYDLLMTNAKGRKVRVAGRYAMSVTYDSSSAKRKIHNGHHELILLSNTNDEDRFVIFSTWGDAPYAKDIHDHIIDSIRLSGEE